MTCGAPSAAWWSLVTSRIALSEEQEPFRVVTCDVARCSVRAYAYCGNSQYHKGGSFRPYGGAFRPCGLSPERGEAAQTTRTAGRGPRAALAHRSLRGSGSP